jgi:phage antirepressor YoqD-like protein
MPRPKVAAPKIHKTIRLSQPELTYIKEIAKSYNVTEQEIFEEGYKLYIEQLKQKAKGV